ncbi:hypothetical protein TRAPUB_11835 [Trametes pubescens]|uniref:Uncharacterized protein n=1 Tax=Trametes pubescens TaxID=154538 RepID=A0A1M2VVK7_TRAPU|nr:hypothetical protein TRAPUB_11835 [Trametes pubescens]
MVDGSLTLSSVFGIALFIGLITRSRMRSRSVQRTNLAYVGTVPSGQAPPGYQSYPAPGPNGYYNPAPGYAPQYPPASYNGQSPYPSASQPNPPPGNLPQYAPPPGPPSAQQDYAPPPGPPPFQGGPPQYAPPPGPPPATEYKQGI